jgi:hypothetical protein
MSIEPKVGPADSLAVFEGICAAAGVEPGIERIAVLVRLPEQLQATIWRAVAERLERETEAPR